MENVISSRAGSTYTKYSTIATLPENYGKLWKRGRAIELPFVRPIPQRAGTPHFQDRRYRRQDSKIYDLSIDVMSNTPIAPASFNTLTWMKSLLNHC